MITAWCQVPPRQKTVLLAVMIIQALYIPQHNISMLVTSGVFYLKTRSSFTYLNWQWHIWCTSEYKNRL